MSIDFLMRVWVAQLVENAMDCNPEQIEVRFYNRGIVGFDVVDDGDGIPDKELPHICKCLEARKRNEIYKRKSIGYRGEALNSIAKSSTLTVLTKHIDSEFAWKVSYNMRGEIENIE